MLIFDWYEPVPAMTCPVCGDALDEWQGTDGPNGLFVWRQGEASPVDQRVDADIKVDLGTVGRLPNAFQIRAFDDDEHKVVAIGATEGLRWSDTTLSAVLQDHEGRKGGQFTRVPWGDAPWLTKASRDR